MPITEPGVYQLSAEEYHADPVETPSLSASICKLILERSPRHAMMAHPRLNPNAEDERKLSFDLGTAAHVLLLQGLSVVEVIEAENYKTKAAQASRDAAYAAGKTPLLTDQAAGVAAMVAAARAQLARHRDATEAFTNGAPEQTLIWREGSLWCRARLDWLPRGGNVFFDYKTTGASAAPDQWGKRQCYDTGCDVQAAFYRRAIKAVLGIDNAHFRFVVQETSPPYALSVVALTPYALALAERKIEEAIGWWSWCMDHGHWPGYPARVAYVDPPPWHDAEWTAQADRRQIEAEAGEDARAALLDWMVPLGNEGTVKEVFKL